ncbi:MAG: LPS export ABC transporter periplasmic protein LptC [Leptospiraceae bacterium]|nr:LPS export ABC transporter periplasmic protein LptC [Leptospiraceae bacterium]MDW8306695.1 LPS export ABC transporter periplasmic protein LptC [Leptospiraceae bacterium]
MRSSCLGLGLIFLSCQQSPPLLVREPDAILHQFTAKNYRNNELDWFLTAERGELYLGDKENHLFGVHIIHYENGKRATEISSRRAIQKENEKTLLLEEDVIVRSITGRTLYAQELIWYENEQLLVSHKPVKISLPSGDIIEGQSLKADKRLNKITLKEGRGVHPTYEEDGSRERNS